MNIYQLTKKTVFLILTCVCMNLFVFDLEANEEFAEKMLLKLELEGFDAYAGLDLEILPQAPLSVNGEKYVDEKWHVDGHLDFTLPIKNQKRQTHWLEVPRTYHELPTRSVYLKITTADGRRVGKSISLKSRTYKKRHDDHCEPFKNVNCEGADCQAEKVLCQDNYPEDDYSKFLNILCKSDYWTNKDICNNLYRQNQDTTNCKVFQNAYCKELFVDAKIAEQSLRSQHKYGLFKEHLMDAVYLDAKNEKHMFEELKEFKFSVDIFEPTQMKYDLSANHIHISVSRMTSNGSLFANLSFDHQAEGVEYTALLPYHDGDYWIFLDAKKVVNEAKVVADIRSSYSFQHQPGGIKETFELKDLNEEYYGKSASSVFSDLTDMSFFPFSKKRKKAQAAKRISQNIVEMINNSEGRSYVYFFAGYCGPCLDEGGLARFFKNSEGSDDLVIGLHSNFYRGLAPIVTPESQEKMLEFLNKKDGSWKHIKKYFNDHGQAKSDNPNHYLMFEEGLLAQTLVVNGYPALFVFDENAILLDLVSGDSVKTYAKSLKKNIGKNK